MAKLHPADTQNKSLVGRRPLEEFVKGILGLIQADEASRYNWLAKQAHFYRRRYAREFRGTDWPWPNASDIVMPTMDMAIDRLKPAFIRSTLGTKPVVTLIARNPQSQQRAALNEIFLDWLMETRIPDAAEQVAFGSDWYLQHGHVVFKVFYDYRTRRVKDVITKERIPREVLGLLAGQNLNEQERDQLFQLTGRALLGKRDAARFRAQLAPMVQRLFDLDPEDKDDAKAGDEIMDWILRADPEEKTLTVKLREVVVDTPRFVAVRPENLIVAPYVTEVQNARRITHKLFFTEEELLERARDSKWNRTVVKTMLERGGDNERSKTSRSPSISSVLEQALDAVSETGPPRILRGSGPLLREELYEVWEIYAHLDIDGDGMPEKVVLWVDPVSSLPLRIIELPFKHGQWPFVQIRLEHSDPRFYTTRGVPERLDDLDIEITSQHRAKLNRMTIANAPVFIYRMGSKLNPANLRFVPGQMYPVSTMNDIAPLTVPNLDVSFEREEQVLLSWIERRVGTLDTALSSQERLTRPRSATEIRALGNIQAELVGSQILLWQKGMAKVYNMLWDLWSQYGPQEVFLRVTGAEETDLLKFTRYDIQGDFDFVPTPSALNNPFTRVETAQLVFQTLAQVPPEFWGPRFEVNLGEAALSILEEIDSRRSRRVIRRRTDAEVQEILQQQQAPPLRLDGSAPVDTEVASGVLGRLGRAAKQGKIPAQVNVEKT